MEAKRYNVRRAYIQTAIWKSAVKSEPPTLEPTKYGWSRDVASRLLIPIMLPPNVALALSEVLEMIRCGCFLGKLCYTAQCRCTTAKLQQFSVLVMGGGGRAAGMNKHRQLQHLPVMKTDNNEE